MYNVLLIISFNIPDHVKGNIHIYLQHLLLGRKVMTNLDSILKNRDITLSTQVCLVKAMVFPVVMYLLHGYMWELVYKES